MQVLLNAPLFGPLLEERTSSSENKYTLENPNSKEQVELEVPECDFAVRTLVDLYKTYSTSSQRNTSIAPSKLMNCIRQKTGRFQRQVQEDSHELLRSLIDIIRSDEIRRQRAAITSYLGDDKSAEFKADCFTVIDMIFGGYFLSSVQCQKCRYKSQHLEPFYDLSLAITDPISDVRSAIANFTSNAILDGDNKFICERCSKVNGKKTYEAGVKSTKIAVPPNILTLHLKRFEANNGAGIDLKGAKGGLGGGRKGKKGGGGGGGGRRKGKSRGRDDDDDDGFVCGRGGVNFRKINKHVEFTEFLDLSDFTSDLCYNLTKINKWPRIHDGDPIWYSLFGVVCHSGNLRGGHYTAYVKCEDPVNETYSMEDFAEFIQETPYIPELSDIDKIESSIKQYDARRCGESDNGIDSNPCDKPKSIQGQWYHISDSVVSRATLANVLESQAYIVFYRRVIE